MFCTVCFVRQNSEVQIYKIILLTFHVNEIFTITHQSRFHAISLWTRTPKLSGQALSINFSTRWQIGISANPSNDIKNTFAMTAKIERSLPDDWTCENTQNGCLQKSLNATSSHWMEHWVLRVVNADQWSLHRRALFVLVSHRLILLLECLQPVLIFVQILVKLSRIQNIILHTLLVAVKFNNQVVENGDAAEGRHQVAGLSC